MTTRTLSAIAMMVAIPIGAAHAQSVLGPGASNFDVLGQGANSNYNDHPTGPVSQATSTGNSGTLAGGAGGSGGAGGTSRSTGNRVTNNPTTNGNSVTVNNSTGGGSGNRGNGWGPGSWGAQTAVAPSYGSANPCSGIPTSGAAQGAGFFGFSFGTSNFDESCRLNEARGNPVAMAYLCRYDPKIRLAAMDAGLPCPQDMIRVVYKPSEHKTVDVGPLDYCMTASAGERKQHLECVGVRRE